MKYNININQYAIVEKLKLDIDLIDAVVLDYLYWICASVSPKIHQARIERNGELYTWINYNHFFDENPVLKIKSKGFLSARLERLEKRKLIKTFVTTGYYKRKYVYINEITESIYSNTIEKRTISDYESCSLCGRTDLPLNNHHYELGTEKTVRICTNCHVKTHLNTFTPVHADEHCVHLNEHTPVHADEHIIKLSNNNTRDNGFEDFWKEYPKKKEKPKAIEAWKKLNPDKELSDKIIDAVKRYKNTKDWQKENGAYIIYPERFIKRRKWEDDIEEEYQSEVININQLVKEKYGNCEDKRGR